MKINIYVYKWYIYVSLPQDNLYIRYWKSTLYILYIYEI